MSLRGGIRSLCQESWDTGAGGGDWEMNYSSVIRLNFCFKRSLWDFPGGPLVKNLFSNIGN